MRCNSLCEAVATFVAVTLLHGLSPFEKLGVFVSSDAKMLAPSVLEGSCLFIILVS